VNSSWNAYQGDGALGVQLDESTQIALLGCKAQALALLLLEVFEVLARTAGRDDHAHSLGEVLRQVKVDVLADLAHEVVEGVDHEDDLVVDRAQVDQVYQLRLQLVVAELQPVAEVDADLVLLQVQPLMDLEDLLLASELSWRTHLELVQDRVDHEEEVRVVAFRDVVVEDHDVRVALRGEVRKPKSPSSCRCGTRATTGGRSSSRRRAPRR